MATLQEKLDIDVLFIIRLPFSSLILYLCLCCGDFLTHIALTVCRLLLFGRLLFGHTAFRFWLTVFFGLTTFRFLAYCFAVRQIHMYIYILYI